MHTPARTTLDDTLAGVVRGLRTAPAARLGAAAGRFGTRADAGRALAAALALAVQGIEAADRGEAAPPSWRELPRLPDLAVGDQVAVTAHDLQGVLAGAHAEVWTTGGRAPLSRVIADLGSLAAEVAALL